MRYLLKLATVAVVVFSSFLAIFSFLAIGHGHAANQGLAENQGLAANESPQDPEFGPVVRAYLGYLQNEQEVVDDRASRHEVNQAYYRRNSNRIRALRQMAIRIARESRNDYLPELEAVTRNEMRLLFEQPPRVEALREGEVLNRTFRFLGSVRAVEVFYVFARLDPYEQAELAEKTPEASPMSMDHKPGPTGVTRARRATSPR